MLKLAGRGKENQAHLPPAWTHLFCCVKENDERDLKRADLYKKEWLQLLDIPFNNFFCITVKVYISDNIYSPL